jgi:hypothetical protein
MENENKESNIKATIDAVTGLVQAVPVYQDAMQPAAKQIGKSLETVSKTVNIALAPIKALVWGYEKIEEFISTRVSEKLKNVPEENIVTPPPQVAGPTVEALRYAGHDENLRELYANLLATSMDKETVKNAHPAFVEILKNITSEEAIILTLFKNVSSYPAVDINGFFTLDDNSRAYKVYYSHYCEFHKKVKINDINSVSSYIDNLARLGILQIIDLELSDSQLYVALENSDELETIKKFIYKKDKKLEFKRKTISLTLFGLQFVKSVVVDKNES